MFGVNPFATHKLYWGKKGKEKKKKNKKDVHDEIIICQVGTMSTVIHCLVAFSQLSTHHHKTIYLGFCFLHI
jgi:hypothetical protein